jgi:multidrug transporter EmrE-like cation transporter
VTETALGSLLAIGCAAVEGLAQVALKQSTRQPPRRPPWIAAGVVLFAAEGVLYTAALQRLDLGVAYSFGALSFVTVSLLSAYFLRESVPVLRWIGIVCIVAGTALLATYA